MAAFTTKVQICQLANSGLGNRNTITNIDTPRNDKETIFSQWYDIVRQRCLKTMMPNFALTRIIVSQKDVPAGYADSYKYAFEYPHRCLKLLGVGDIDKSDCNSVTVEGNLIFTNNQYASGMPLRIVDDITDVSKMSSDFITYFAAELRAQVALSVTQDPGKKKSSQEDAKTEAMNASALNAQENKPIRKSVSRWRASRTFNVRDDRSGEKR